MVQNVGFFVEVYLFRHITNVNRNELSVTMVEVVGIVRII